MVISKYELMLRGARSRLVELNKERLELIKMFKELDIAEAEQKPANNDLLDPPVGASGRRLQKKGPPHRIWNYLTQHPGTTTAIAVAGVLKITLTQARGALNQLVKQKLAVKVGRGTYKLK